MNIAVRYATFAVAKRKPEKTKTRLERDYFSGFLFATAKVYKCDDHPSFDNMIMMMMIIIKMRIMTIMMMTVMIITIRDGSLEKVIRGVWGICRLHEFFFRSLIVQEFCFQVNPSARIFFFRQIPYCFFLNRKILINYLCFCAL